MKTWIYSRWSIHYCLSFFEVISENMFYYLCKYWSDKLLFSSYHSWKLVEVSSKHFTILKWNMASVWKSILTSSNNLGSRTGSKAMETFYNSWLASVIQLCNPGHAVMRRGYWLSVPVFCNGRHSDSGFGRLSFILRKHSKNLIIVLLFTQDSFWNHFLMTISTVEKAIET